MHSKNKKYFIIGCLVLFLFGATPVEFGRENTFFHGFSIPQPVIRVGLGTNLMDVHVRASSGMKVYEVNANYRLLAEDADEVRVKGSKEKLAEKLVLLAGQADEREEAETFARDLRSKIQNNVYVEEYKEPGLPGVFRVIVGDFLTRGDALIAIQKINF